MHKAIADLAPWQIILLHTRLPSKFLQNHDFATWFQT